MRVLVVDDEAAAQNDLERAVHEVDQTAALTVCASAEEALDLPDLASFEVAFLDIQLPGMSGLELADALQRIKPSINVVFVTAHAEHMGAAFRLHASGYLVKPVTPAMVADELANLRFSVVKTRQGHSLYMRCFGNFEVFYNGLPLTFQRMKTKELLAYLVDRRGAMVSLHEVDASLWEDAPHGVSISGSYLRTLVADLKSTLEEVGCADILLKQYGQLGIDTSRFGCDYYDYLRGNIRAARHWAGEYMSQYSWAERTRAALMR